MGLEKIGEKINRKLMLYSLIKDLIDNYPFPAHFLVTEPVWLSDSSFRLNLPCFPDRSGSSAGRYICLRLWEGGVGAGSVCQAGLHTRTPSPFTSGYTLLGWASGLSWS